jgi:hypothetical protein
MRHLTHRVVLSLVVLTAAPLAHAEPNVPAEAPADSPPASAPSAAVTGPTALQLGARLAYGAPFGSVTGASGADLDHAMSSQFALVLDGGLRLTPGWYVGATFSYGAASASDQFAQGACKANGVSCSSSVVRLGVNAQYHFVPDGRYDPWIGMGGGYEWASMSVSDAGQTVHLGMSGWEFANLQAGLDFRLGSRGAIGPFAALTLAEYQTANTPTDYNGGTTSQSISEQAMHEWFFVGVRGTYDIALR